MKQPGQLAEVILWPGYDRCVVWNEDRKTVLFYVTAGAVVLLVRRRSWPISYQYPAIAEIFWLLLAPQGLGWIRNDCLKGLD